LSGLSRLVRMCGPARRLHRRNYLRRVPGLLTRPSFTIPLHMSYPE
jgi:hypothetical protein